MKNFILIVLVILVAGFILWYGIHIYYERFPAGFTDKAEYGQFGDYINPFLTFINAIFLITLTLMVERNNRKKHEEALLIQEKVNLLTLRLEAHNEIIKVLDIKTHCSPNNIDVPNFVIILNFFEKIDSNYGFLFPAIKENETTITLMKLQLDRIKNVFLTTGREVEIKNAVSDYEINAEIFKKALQLNVLNKG